MLYVIEGVDRTGKSTLANYLKHTQQPGFYGVGEVIHWERPKCSSAIDEYVQPLMDYEPGAGRTVVCDRHFLGERVWPHIFGRESLMSLSEQECVELFLRDRGAVCVLATREPGDLEAACADEPCAGRAAEAQTIFEVQAALSSLAWWPWRHGDDPTRLITYAQAQEEDAAHRRAFAREDRRIRNR